MKKYKNRRVILAFLGGFNAKVHSWGANQDARACGYLDALPQQAPIHQQLVKDISAFLFDQPGMQLLKK